MRQGEFGILLAADLEDGGQLGQFRLVLVGVMLAEQKLSSGRQLCPHPRRRTAAVAAVCPGQLGTGQSCVHGFSVLACVQLCQTFKVFALFPDCYRVCRFSRVSE